MQVNHVETIILNMQPKTTGNYDVTSLAKNPDDEYLCDDKT